MCIISQTYNVLFVPFTPLYMLLLIIQKPKIIFKHQPFANLYTNKYQLSIVYRTKVELLIE